MRGRVAFIHFGKCAGVFTMNYLSRVVLRRGFKVLDSWPRLKRDWHDDELRKFLKLPGKALVHNHHINWREPVVDDYLDAGWFVFTFLRHPADLIASLYFWGRKMSKRDANPFAPDGVNPGAMTADRFFNVALDNPGMRNLWTLPPYVERISFVDEFTTLNFRAFLSVHFGHEYGTIKVGARHRNASDNPGFAALVAAGAVHSRTVNRLYGDEAFREYERYVDLWEPTFPS